LYELIKNTQSKYEKKDFYKIIINFPRDELINRIRVRVENMIKNGAILEVKKFVKLKVPKSKTVSKAIGINEITDYLKKKLQKQDVIEKISIKTRQYAKRQVTWSRGNMVDWNFVNTKDINKFLNKIN
jgi:tRNA dimethylallyltransferase